MCQNFRRKWTRPLVTSNLPWRKTYSTALRDTSISSVLEPTADLKVGTKVWKLIEKRKTETLERNKFIFRSEQLWKNFCVLALWEILHCGNGGEWDQGVGGNDIFQFEYDAASLKDHLGKNIYFMYNEEENKLIQYPDSGCLCLISSVYFHDDPVITKSHTSHQHQVCIYLLTPLLLVSTLFQSPTM